MLLLIISIGNIEKIIKKGNFTREELIDDIKNTLEKIGGLI